MLILLALAACVPESGAPSDGTDALSALDPNIAASQAECRTRGKAVLSYGPQEWQWACGAAEHRAMVAQERRITAQCAAVGSRLQIGGPEGWYCANPTADAGKSCRASTECEGTCFAAERGSGGTCAPLTTFLGCHTILDERGERIELCVD